MLHTYELAEGAPWGDRDGRNDGPHLSCIDRRIFWRFRVAGALLREPHGPEGTPIMNWVYWLSGIAALGIFVYLIIALFKPEYFE
jgi:K+-transporting ATPase KdpF subunit